MGNPWALMGTLDPQELCFLSELRSQVQKMQMDLCGSLCFVFDKPSTFVILLFIILLTVLIIQYVRRVFYLKANLDE